MDKDTDSLESNLEATSAFFETHSALFEKILPIFSKAAGSIPNELYHYTSATAALKIIETGELWASNALYLNGFNLFETEMSAFKFESLAFSFEILFLKQLCSHSIPSLFHRFILLTACCRHALWLGEASRC